LDRGHADFGELRKETVRKVPEVRDRRPFRSPKRRCSARFGPAIPTNTILAALLVPLFGQFQGEVRRIYLLYRFHERRELDGCDCRARSIPEMTTSSVGLGCASALVQERQDVLGKSLRDKNVRDVLLAFKYLDPRIGQHGGHGLDLCLAWVGALFADEKENRHGDLRCQLWIEGSLRLGSALSGDRVRGRHTSRP
jgi:hypothetical protein